MCTIVYIINFPCTLYFVTLLLPTWQGSSILRRLLWNNSDVLLRPGFRWTLFSRPTRTRRWLKILSMSATKSLSAKLTYWPKVGSSLNVRWRLVEWVRPVDIHSSNVTCDFIIIVLLNHGIKNCFKSCEISFVEYRFCLRLQGGITTCLKKACNYVTTSLWCWVILNWRCLISCIDSILLSYIDILMVMTFHMYNKNHIHVHRISYIMEK